MIITRTYQQDMIDEITTAAAYGKRRILCQAPTGSGKTCIACSIIRHAVGNGKKALFLAHRREIVWQTEKKLLENGIEAGIMMGDYPYDPTRSVTIASIPTIYSRAIRRKRESLPPADIVIVDESHTATAPTWEAVLHQYPHSFILGMTATPIRQTGKGLGHAFDELIIGPSIQRLMDEGWLVPVKYYVASVPDLMGVKIRNGDYIESELEARMNKPELIGDVVKNWIAANCQWRKTLVFAAGIKHSIQLADNFNAIGIKAKHVDGDTAASERDLAIAEFSSGKLQVLTNCNVFCEGTDLPPASCLVFARPTKSLRLYLQVVGRVLRPFQDKTECILLDHAGVVYEHGPVAQNWDWKLDYGESTIQDKMQKLKKERIKRQIICKGCKLVYEGRIDCPQCGARPARRGEPYPTYEAYLQELDSGTLLKEITADRKAWYLGFRAFSQSKGYARGWAAHKYKEKFGNWPASLFVHEADGAIEFPEIPLDVRAWIKHKQIQYAQSNKPKDDQKWKQSTDSGAASHGLDRKDVMAANAYQPGE